MTRKNYEEMRNGVTTEVLIPYSKDLHSLQIIANAIHPYPVFACAMITPSAVESVEVPNIISNFSSTHKYNLHVGGINASGIYTFKCSGKQFQFPTFAFLSRTAAISLYLNFITGVYSNLVFSFLYPLYANGTTADHIGHGC